MKPGKQTGGRANSGRQKKQGPKAAAPRRGAADRPARPQGSSFASRGAGRTGPVRAAGAEPRSRPVGKGLGGEQVEGRQAVRELLLAGRRRTREIWISSDLEANDTIDVIVEIARHERVPVQFVARKRLETTARSEAPQGIIAFADPLPEAEFASFLRRGGGRQPFLVAVDGVTDPGNLGALVRSCDGAGVHGVVLPRHRAVHVTPTVAKAAAGAVEHVPIAVVGGLPTALSQMKDAGIWVVGLDDAADRELFDIDEFAVEGICLVMGAEGAGLSRLVRERCDLIVSIPMLGRLSSLNVSAAAAVATYEVARARRRSA